MAVSISICNQALGELRAPSIVDIMEDSMGARECARYYPACLDLLLERLDWSFATKIVPLAALTNNIRSSEWLYAYGLPADLGTAMRLVPGGAALAGFCRYRRLPERGAPFIIEADILYTQMPNAILEYSAASVAEAQMTALFKDALVFSLAARLAVPIRDSREMKAQLLQQAEIAAQRAVADDMNRQPRREEPAVDEVTIARNRAMFAYGGE